MRGGTIGGGGAFIAVTPKALLVGITLCTLEEDIGFGTETICISDGSLILDAKVMSTKGVVVVLLQLVL